LRETRDRRELLLEWRRHRRGHGIGARARQSRGHRDGGKVHRRQRGDREQPILAMPNTRIPAISSDVPIGLRMKISETFICRLLLPVL
jgi:hypothetical protein